MEEDLSPLDGSFPLFSRKPKRQKSETTSVEDSTALQTTEASTPAPVPAVEKETETNPTTETPTDITFSELGLAEWACTTCNELGMKRPTPVQRHCIPRILAGQDVLGLAQTGSGKTAAFALPILHRLAGDPYGVFALVMTPTRELAYQLAEQFKALGSGLHLRCSVIIGGMDIINQAQTLMSRPHVVISTPGRIKVLIEENPDDIPAVFSKTKFLVLDEADRLLDVGFEEELRVVFQCLPKSRQTLLFSATMTSELETLLQLSANKAYFYEAYEGFKTVESLKQQYLFLGKSYKEVYLFYVLSKLEDMNVRSAIIFVSTCKSCQLLSLFLEELDVDAAALHSFKSQALRLSAIHKFKSGKVPILLATDVASRGLDIPAVDLVINYDIPRFPRDYVHRVGRTARAGRGGLALSFVTQNDLCLLHEIEAVLGKQLEKFECDERDNLPFTKKVFDAKRVAKMRMTDDGFDEIAKTRKAQKLKMLAEKGLLKKNNKKQKKLEKYKQNQFPNSRSNRARDITWIIAIQNQLVQGYCRTRHTTSLRNSTFHNACSFQWVGQDRRTSEDETNGMASSWEPGCDETLLEDGTTESVDYLVILALERDDTNVVSAHQLASPCSDPYDRNFLVGSDEDVLSVYVGEAWKWCRVFRLNQSSSTLMWEEVKDLKNTNLFYKDSIVYYSLKTSKFHCSKCKEGDDCDEDSLMSYDGSKEQLYCCWFEPTIYPEEELGSKDQCSSEESDSDQYSSSSSEEE
ncbi:OLC1v1022266C1 [Oldenlandia corymbosa var. corymbosa]|uniref:OLC1v1022266C1 n=1 Tax=Oldenlandia corymbosa var. corymbosa TaxID=529605 RepID=A0AAV1C173_OLDCO|nr:OLC1v1022266C1 [Oldenlandia corymbosa var. corymbosa]